MGGCEGDEGVAGARTGANVQASSSMVLRKPSCDQPSRHPAGLAAAPRVVRAAGVALREKVTPARLMVRRLAMRHTARAIAMARSCSA